MPAILSLPSELTIYGVSTLRLQWLAWRAELNVMQPDPPADGLVDGSAVVEVDAAGLQMLVALSRSLQADRRTLRFVAASRVLSDACEALGLPAPMTAEVCP